MAKEFAKKFYRSKKWKRCRASYIAERVMVDGGLCEECHKNLGYILHHEIILTPENIENPEVSLSHEHMKYVCKECHDNYEGHGLGNDKVGLLVFFDDDGQPVSLREVDAQNEK